jgi:hypothetical protein
MMSKVCLIALAVLVVGAVPAAASRSSSHLASSSSKKAQTFKTRRISFLAADGSRAAVVTDGPIVNKVFGIYCKRIAVWNVAGGGSTQLNSGVCVNSSVINKVFGFALAGRRVAWINGDGGNSLQIGVSVYDLGEKMYVGAGPFGYSSNGAEGIPDGSYVWNLAGKGGLIAFNYWSVCTAYPAGTPDEGAPSCGEPAPGDEKTLVYSDQRVIEFAGNASSTIATAPSLQTTWTADIGSIAESHSLPVVWVDGGRVLVQSSVSAMTIYSARGSITTQITAAPSTIFADTVLQGSRLLTSWGNKLALYNASSGAFVKTVRVERYVVLRDLQNGLAVYLTGRRIHVLRLSDGKRFALTPPGKGFVDAQIEAPGLFYAYNMAKGIRRGRIAFIPRSKVVKRLHH